MVASTEKSASTLLSPSSSKKKKKKKQKSTTKQPLVRETCPSFGRGHLADPDIVQRLLGLSAPHVESFDYFLETGLRKGIADIVASEIDIVSPSSDTDETVLFWVENVRITPPIQKTAKKTTKLTPRECRQLSVGYAGPIMGDFCFQVITRRNGSKIPGRIHKLTKQFGDMPIMVMSKACHLRGKTPSELIKLKEEVSIVYRESVSIDYGHLCSPQLYFPIS